MLKLEHLKARAMQLGLYINHHNRRYSVGIDNDFHVDNRTFCCYTKKSIDAFLTGVAYQKYYAPQLTTPAPATPAPQLTTATDHGESNSTADNNERIV
jgi:hypothetical protein